MAPPSRSTLTSRAADSVKGAGEFLLAPNYVTLTQAKDALRSAITSLRWVVQNCGESKSAYPTRPDIREAIMAGGDATYSELRILEGISTALANVEHPEDVPSTMPRALIEVASRLRQIVFVPPPKVRSGLL